jgi:leucyl aminopeptidase
MSNTIDRVYIHFNVKSDDIDVKSKKAKINVMVNNLCSYELSKKIHNIANVIKLYSKINKVVVSFATQELKECILVKLHDVLYPFGKKIGKIELRDIDKKSRILMDWLSEYKDIVMEPNKNPKMMLEWVKSHIPNNYNLTVKKISSSFFPLSHAVGAGSTHDMGTGYFACICPKKVDKKNKNIYLVGKTITYDTGGLNVKTRMMHEMKTDMTGGALLLTVLNILAKSKMDSHLNIHLLLPIVENMIGPNATKPGSVIKTMSGKTVEILNTDAEGRLCIADCMEYIEMEMIEKKRDNLIIDVATLTGNATQITDTIACVGMCNDMAMAHFKEMIDLGEKCGEYVDMIRLRKEYMDKLASNVADIKNCHEGRAGCVVAGQFIDYFVNNMAPWIHLDIAGVTHYNDMAYSWGVNMLTQYLANL